MTAPYSEWSYVDPLAEPPELTSLDTAAIDALVQRDTGTTKSASTYRTSTAGTLNGFNTYPVERVGTAPDEWHVADPSADVPAYVPGDGGTIRQIALGFREMTYQEAKSKARRDLGAYITAYRRSFFTAAGAIFSASDIYTTAYNSIDTFIQSKWTAEQLGGTPIPALVLDYWVLDVDDVEFHITTVPEWNAFVQKWENLWLDAQAEALAAWQAIKGVTTATEVAAIMAALAPIPTIDSLR